MNDLPKFCVNCQYYKAAGEPPRGMVRRADECHHPALATLVRALPSNPELNRVYGGQCGQSAQYFTPKEPKA